MKPGVILLYPAYITRNREFINNRRNVFQWAPYHQDNLISRNLLRCCKTSASSFTLCRETQRVHTGRWRHQRYWGFLGHPVRYDCHCLSNI